MKSYYIDTLGNLEDDSLCVLDSVPEDMGVKYSFLVKGREFGGISQTGFRIHMSSDCEGIKLSSLLGHTKRFLIVENAVKNVIELYPASKIEYIPLKIINHKNRVHNDAYFIVNPVGYLDVVDYELSDIDYFKEKILGINRLVLNEKKMEKCNAIFRIEEDPTRYFVREDLQQEIVKEKFTNFIFKEVIVK